MWNPTLTLLMCIVTMSWRSVLAAKHATVSSVCNKALCPALDGGCEARDMCRQAHNALCAESLIDRAEGMQRITIALDASI